MFSLIQGGGGRFCSTNSFFMSSLSCVLSFNFLLFDQVWPQCTKVRGGWGLGGCIAWAGTKILFWGVVLKTGLSVSHSLSQSLWCQACLNRWKKPDLPWRRKFSSSMRTTRHRTMSEEGGGWGLNVDCRFWLYFCYRMKIRMWQKNIDCRQEAL